MKTLVAFLIIPLTILGVLSKDISSTDNEVNIEELDLLEDGDTLSRQVRDVLDFDRKKNMQKRVCKKWKTCCKQSKKEALAKKEAPKCYYKGNCLVDICESGYSCCFDNQWCCLNSCPWEGDLMSLIKGKFTGQCFNDTVTPKLLRGEVFTGLSTNTVGTCKETCELSGYAYAGVEIGTSCYCGKTIYLGHHNIVDQTYCNTKCPGSPGEFCGGEKELNGKKYEFINLYSTSTKD